MYILLFVIFRIAFFIPIFTNGGLLFLKEREQGVINRAIVCGSSTWEFLFIHLLTQIPNILTTTAILILVPIFLFDLQIKLCLIWEIVLILFITGFLGVSISNKK